MVPGASDRRGARPGAGAAGFAALALWVALFPLRAEPPPVDAAGEPGFVIGRISITLKSMGPGVSQRQFERALEDTPARRDATERMAAVLAGEVSLYEARSLHGQARIDFLEVAARRGDAAAASAVGEMLDSGDGVAEEPLRAFAYFHAGALGGRMDAAHNLGAAYAKGRSGKVDLTEALAWLIVARQRGDPSGAEAQLRRYLSDHGREAAITAAEQRSGSLTVKATPEQVAAALPAPAPITFDETRVIVVGDESNSVPNESDSDTPPVVVMTVLGARHSWPTLTSVERAANRGDATAMAALGRLLTNGKLMPPDPLRAVVWLERSAALGDVDAAQQLGDLYSKGQGIVTDDRKAFTYFLQAANGGSVLAMASVGVCYTNGRGVERDLPRGLAWLAVAKELGVDLGQEGRLRAFLTQHRPADVATADQLAQQLRKRLTVKGP